MRGTVNQKLTLITIRDALLGADGLHLGVVRGVTRHISRQDDADEALAEGFDVVACEAFEEIVLSLVEDCKGLSCMEVLLDGHITVADGAVRDHVHMIRIREAIMTIVVTNS